MEKRNNNYCNLSVERHFCSTGSITFEGIVKSIIEEEVEKYANSSYHDEQVNVAVPVEGSSSR